MGQASEIADPQSNGDYLDGTQLVHAGPSELRGVTPAEEDGDDDTAYGQQRIVGVQQGLGNNDWLVIFLGLSGRNVFHGSLSGRVSKVLLRILINKTLFGKSINIWCTTSTYRGTPFMTAFSIFTRI